MTTAARREQMRQYSRKNYIPTGTLVRRRQTNNQILVAEKRSRNECVLHLKYWGVQKFVIYNYEYLMDMDHIDRTKKHKTISKMMGSPEEKFVAEMAKCQMLCKDCHARKTVEHKDWVSMIKPLQHMIVKIYNQPSLFDIDPL